jgi:XRE family transcriptional regulator, aerobic/anaerobic benzoate catabolism transcriptional regulator
MNHPEALAALALAPQEVADDKKSPLLIALGEQVRDLRAQRGLTRKALSIAADVSERHLANLEYGVGNASILVLQQVASALSCPLAELIGDITTSSPEWLLIRELLAHRPEEDLRRARLALAELLGIPGGDQTRNRRIALIGLRGAGKSTLGRLLAHSLDVPFVELSRDIEKLAGCSIREIYDMYGNNAYRRYERRALQEAMQIHSEVVISAPGGIVSDAATFNELLAHCATIWVQASPEEHMDRVAAQGDVRPMAASKEAMEDLRRILSGRSAFYSKADRVLDTGGRTVDASLQALRHVVMEMQASSALP